VGLSQGLELGLFVAVATIQARLESYSFVQTMCNSFVQQTDPAKDAMRMEEVVKLFSLAFARV
jgi:hypothetical protein